MRRRLLDLRAVTSVLLVPAPALFAMRLAVSDSERIPYSAIAPYAGPVIVLGLLFAVGYVAFLIDVFKREGVPESRRTMWLVLLLAVPNAVTVYWWLYVRRSRSST